MDCVFPKLRDTNSTTSTRYLRPEAIVVKQEVLFTMFCDQKKIDIGFDYALFNINKRFGVDN